LTVVAPSQPSPTRIKTLLAAIAAFHRWHDALGMFPRQQLPELPPGGDPAAAIVERQPIALAAGRVDAPIYDRARLGGGDCIAGPAILTQLDATTLLLSGQTAELHRFGSLYRTVVLPKQRRGDQP
jgi:N-methylhydantoinase A/oxoprolinase/acetone carboxylase beta subunit